MSKTGGLSEAPADPLNRGRRRTLRLLGAVAAGAAAQVVLGTGCAAGPDAPPVTEIPLEELPPGQRVRVLHGETPVELVRLADGVQARSLWCTHYGCEVAWDPERERYLCPCHDGIFGADGRVLSGPPPRPLETVAVRVEGGSVFIEDAGA